MIRHIREREVNVNNDFNQKHFRRITNNFIYCNVHFENVKLIYHI